MELSKAFTLLRTFSSTEMNEFRKYLNSPFFNKSRKILVLFDNIRMHHPEFNSRSLGKKYLYEKIFMKNNSNQRAINNLFSGLVKHINNFIAVKEFLSNDMIIDNLILDQYYFRKLDNMLKLKLNKSIKKIYSDKIHDTSDYYYYYRIYFHLIEYFFRTIKTGKSIDLYRHLSNITGLLQEYYYINRIRLLARLGIIKYLYHNDLKTDKQLLNLLTEIHSVPGAIKHPAKKIFSNIAGSLLKNKPVEYYKIKKILPNIKDKLTDEDYDLIITLMVLYFIQGINENDAAIVNERFFHIKHMIERQVWKVIGGKFIEINFSYAVYCSVKAGDFNWAENFINIYSDYIIEEQKKDTVNFNLAVLNYYKAVNETKSKSKYFDLSFEYLSLYKTKDIYQKLNAFELEARLLYESANYDRILNNCTTYLHFVYKHKKDLVEQVYKSHYNFAKYITDLAIIVIDNSLKKLQNLKTLIINSDLCLNKIWLLNKVSSLGKL